MKQGKVLKAYGGYFFVYEFESKRVYQCKARGRLKKEEVEIIVGDRVEFKILQEEDGIIEDRLERENKLFRPPIANIDQILIVFATISPKIDFKLLDRMLVLAEYLDLTPIICINKIDLLDSKEEYFLEAYHNAGYNLVYTSATEEIGLERLKESLADKVSVLAGPSGVGKSSLLNSLVPDLELETGELSKKIDRGRHTTKRVELLSIGQGWVADTPGFSSLKLKDITENQLPFLFPEMNQYLNQCKFSPCSHSHEPSCAIKEAVDKGLIAKTRYRNYLEFLREIKENRKNKY